MEEQVGSAWHKLITRAARLDYPHAAVSLNSLMPALSILYRGLGGAPGMQIKAGDTRRFRLTRSWLQVIAGSAQRHAIAWIQDDTLYLPAHIACFPEPYLNHDCYLWLIALSAQDTRCIQDWLHDNRYRSAQVLQQLPGMQTKYQRMLTQHLQRRRQHAASDHVSEHAIQRSLQLDPLGLNNIFEQDPFNYMPVPLWLYPSPAQATQSHKAQNAHTENFERLQTKQKNRRKRKAAYVDHQRGDNGLLAFRLESLFTWSEFVNLARCHDDMPEKDSEKIADDLDVLSLAQDRSLSTAAAIKFDLDLPAAQNDDLHLGPGISLPEWDYQQQQLLADHCRLQPILSRDASPCGLPARLQPIAAKLRRQFESLKPLKIWQRRQNEGEHIDLDAWLDYRSGMRQNSEQRFYQACKKTHRDLACLLLADLSFSTDAWVNNDCRVIDLIRDSLFLFSEALHTIGDRFAIYGFSSKQRAHVRFSILKNFNEFYTDTVRGRIQALHPGYYTRMGAAIRQSVKILQAHAAEQRILLLLSDGKPNDLDRYEGRYGIEDTRAAIHEARCAGVHPFCITIDEEAHEYLPYLFTSSGYLLIRNALQLPQSIARLYLQLTH